jgi:major outer membrane protein
MKKSLITLLTVLASGSAYALPVGNPSDASLLCDGLLWEGHCADPCDPCLAWYNAFSFRLGFYGDYVFNRHLEIDTNEDDSDIEHTRISTNAALLTANLWDRLDLFATLGATSFDIDTNAFAFGGTNGSRLELESETNFSWSVGLRGTVWECGCTSLGIEGQYFFMRPDMRRVTQGADTSVYPDNIIDAKYREWQIGAGISHRINIFVPYVAVKWSRARLTFDNGIPNPTTLPGVKLFNTKNKKDWGWALGVSLVDCEKASLTVEGRFSDEKAVHVNGQIRF